MSSTAITIARMAQALAGAKVDLRDEKSCIRALHKAHFGSSTIIVHGDRAAKAAQQQILIIDEPETDSASRVGGAHWEFTTADIVIHNGSIVKDRHGIFAGVSS